MSGSTRISTTVVAWRTASIAALAYGVGAGFFAAGFLGAFATEGRAAEPAYRTLLQAHGRAQAFGFGELLALGIALHFLPKLRHAPLAWPRLANAAISLVATGVTLRLGPALSLLTDDPAVTETASLGAALGAMLTLAGTATAVAVLARTHVNAPIPTGDAAITPVIPLVGAAWASLLVAQTLDVVGTVGALAASTAGLVGPTLDDAIVWLAIPGWFIPLAMAFASRTFPLYLRTRLATASAMRSWLGVFVVGMIVDLAGRAALATPTVGAVGQVCEGVAFLGWLYALGVWRSRPPLPGRIADPYVRRAEAITGTASEVAILVACAWLAVAGVMLAMGGTESLSGFGPAPSVDAVRHAIGAGVMLPMIVGMAIRLLPGFAGDRPDMVGRTSAWVASLAAVGASVLRAGPATVAWLDASGVSVGFNPSGTTWLFPAALVGAGAVGALWWSLRRSLGW
jgi:uncharacterized protein involved in response to NO